MTLENILRKIYPDENQLKCLNGIISTLGNILKFNSSFFKVKKVMPAGSLAKGTILKNHLEVDCVYILEHNGYSFDNNFNEVVRALRDNLSDGTQFEMRKHAISFELSKPIGNVHIDLLPAFETNCIEQLSLVKNRDSYYGSTALWQKKYFNNVKKKYGGFSDLVRLMKLWRNTKNMNQILSSYMVELIVANAVAQTKDGEDFDFYLEMCFRMIQSFTDGTVIVPVYWEDYYDNSKIHFRNSKSNLWIIDPSDPSENLAEDIDDDEKQYLRSEASYAITKMRRNDFNFLYK